ncbi:MAG: hypothetical protein EOR56_34075, partial [Mesorhizobium sp.]
MRWNHERFGAGPGAFCGSALCSTFFATVTLPGAGFGSGGGCGIGSRFTSPSRGGWGAGTASGSGAISVWT